MPVKVLPGTEAFERFTKALLRRGFRKFSREEFREDFERLGLKAPSPREGREVGFVYTQNGLTVFVWTTFLCEEDHVRNEDAGWVLIREGDEVKYYSHPLHRTRFFLRNLFKQACIAQLRVENRPSCPKCGMFMDIVRGKKLKARYWQCKRPTAHKEPTFLSWDYGLSKAALDFLHPLRKERARYRKERRAQGKRIGTALLQRRKWKVERPENIVPA
jgi:hypothetical protein